MEKFEKLYDLLDGVALTMEQRVSLFYALAEIEKDYEDLAASRRPMSFTWVKDIEAS